MKIIGVLFTKGVSLEQWIKNGIFQREKAIYEEYLKQGRVDYIYWFTYGIEDDIISRQLYEKEQLDKRIIVIPKPKYFSWPGGHFAYSICMQWVQKDRIKELSLIKSNQLDGAWTGEIIRRKFHIPFLLRTGYTYTDFMRKSLKQSESIFERISKGLYLLIYTWVEKYLYRNCNVATVSSKRDKKYICNKYMINKDRVHVVGNYIDCDNFKPITSSQKKYRCIFVGRITQQKNLFETIKGIILAGIGLDIYGDGELKEEIEKFIFERQADVKLKGNISNAKMPAILNQYKYFILASEYEGMPKTLLEAMACGLVCIGTNVAGIEEIIQDGKNGFLARDCSKEAIAEAIRKAINHTEDSIVKSAVAYIREKYSLSVVMNKEWKLIKDII